MAHQWQHAVENRTDITWNPGPACYRICRLMRALGKHRTVNKTLEFKASDAECFTDTPIGTTAHG